MDQRSDQILEHIEAQRDRLGQNLNELESRVKETTDWRAQFEKRPMVMMGVAMGGGLLLGAIVGGGGSSSKRSSSYRYSSAGAGANAWTAERGYSPSASTASSSSRSTSPVVQEQKQRAIDTLDHIKAALIGFGAAKAKEYLSEMLPGFHQHLSEAERHGGSKPGQSSTGAQSGASNLSAETYQSGSNSYPGSAGSFESGSGSFNGPYEGSTASRSESDPSRTPGY